MLKLLRSLKPYLLPVAGVILLIFAQAMADLSLPTLMSDIIDSGVMRGDTAYILRAGGRMLLVTGVSLLAAMLASWLSSSVAARLGASLRHRVFAQVERFSLEEFDRFGAATLITRTTNDVTQVQNVTVMMLRMMVMAPVMAAGGLVMALGENPALSLVLGIAIPLLGLLIWFLASRAMPLFKSMQTKVDRLNLVLREGLTGIRVIRAFDRSAREEARFDAANQDITATSIAVNRLMAFLMPAVMLIMNLTSISVLWFGIGRIDAGAMSMGSLMAFIQYAMQIMFSLVMLSLLFIMVPRAAAAAERLEELLQVKPSIVESAPAGAAGSVSSDASRGSGEIEFRNVRFSYHGAEAPALRDISFSARPGEVTAIVGSTGSGKSTLVKLLPRFYDPEEGVILLGGRDIRDLGLGELRSRIGYVPQKAFLFSGSIAENLRYGAEGASDAELAEAAAVAQAAEFIAALEGGYGHGLAQGGTNVSGGQKQRLSIARALARKPEIYIFDDSFSALDFKTDAALRAALRPRLSGATVLLVAQRIGTVMDADRIVVLDEGRIVGIGRHRELLGSCAVYRELAASQLSEEELA